MTAPVSALPVLRKDAPASSGKHRSGWSPREDRWTRLLAGVCAALALATVYFICLRPKPNSADIFCTASNTGKAILQTRGIPHSDPFSWTAQGQPWVVHGWLATVLLHIIGTRLPDWTLLHYKGGIAALVAVLLLWRARLRSASWLFSIGAAVLAGFALSD